MGTSSLNLIFNLVSIALTGGMLGVVLRYRTAMRGLVNKDNADIRDHYAEELNRVIERQRACEQREMELRGRVRALEGKLLERDNDILGLIRIITQASADKVLMLDGGTSVMIHEMAERIKNEH